MRQDQLFELEKQLRSVFRKSRRELNSTLGDELSANEYTVLKIVYRANSIKASDISKELNVSASHITFITDSLVKKGLITRLRSETDRRVVELRLTDEGVTKVKEIEVLRSDYFRSRFSGFTEQELNDFIRLFKKLN